MAKPSAVLAQVPSLLLQVAAQFASTDPGKPAIQSIQLRNDGETLQISALNGHYAFRCRIPNDTAGDWWMLDAELLLSAKTFAKRSAYATQALIRADGEARFYGAKKREAIGLLEARPLTLGCDGYTFPPLDPLWPDSFSNTPGASIAWNAGYMETISKAVEQLAPNNVARFQSNGPTRPLAVSCSTPWDDVWAEFLLMPVQIRA